MGITKQLTIWCDNCVDWEQISAQTNKEIRDFVQKERGWKRIHRKDYCAKCAKKLIQGPDGRRRKL